MLTSFKALFRTSSSAEGVSFCSTGLRIPYYWNYLFFNNLKILVQRKYDEFTFKSISNSKDDTAIFIKRTVSNFFTIGILNLPSGPSMFIRTTSNLEKTRRTSLLTNTKPDKKVEFVLTEKDSDGWNVVNKGGKHNKKNQN